MTRPPQHDVLAEVAELAHSYGWSLDTALDLEHRDRHILLATARAAS